MGSLRVSRDRATSLSLLTFTHWRRKWQPTRVLLPGESQGRGAWWAAVYGVAQSRTRLKRLGSCSRASQVMLAVKNPPASAGGGRDTGLTPGSGRSPGGGHSNPLLYSCLESPMNTGAWRAAVHGVAKNQTGLKRPSLQRVDGIAQAHKPD